MAYNCRLISAGNATSSAIAVLPRVLGTLFYYSPTSEQASGVIAALAELPELLDWPKPDLIEGATRRVTVAFLREVALAYEVTAEPKQLYF